MSSFKNNNHTTTYSKRKRIINEKRMGYLSIIQTQTCLYQYVETCEKFPGESPYSIQCEIICRPLLGSFPKMRPEELQYELLCHGLFDPDEWVNLKNTVKEMEGKNIWQIVDQEYQLLRNLWKGPKVPIFIFPIKKEGLEVSEQMPTKNGVTYKGVVFLFLSAELSIEEIKALLAHEYNHVCRLTYLGLDFDKIPLKDSLIIEGLGEYAVKDLYGERWLATWTNLYSFKDTIEIWNKHFIPSLNLLGTKNHELFLYGNVRSHFPKWIGYQVGYQIVDSFQKRYGPFNNNELYCKSSEEIIAGSDFTTNKLF
jgi:uncharacterized protein YjaZ